eukprot:1160287-Pelagomonas_calceolata.AAC.5
MPPLAAGGLTDRRLPLGLKPGTVFVCIPRAIACLPVAAVAAAAAAAPSAPWPRENAPVLAAVARAAGGLVSGALLGAACAALGCVVPVGQAVACSEAAAVAVADGAPIEVGSTDGPEVIHIRGTANGGDMRQSRNTCVPEAAGLGRTPQPRPRAIQHASAAMSMQRLLHRV